jgi:hypothetical protein
VPKRLWAEGAAVRKARLRRNARNEPVTDRAFRLEAINAPDVLPVKTLVRRH